MRAEEMHHLLRLFSKHTPEGVKKKKKTAIAHFSF